MSLIDALRHIDLAASSVPELRYLEAAAERVRARWPDVQARPSEKDREELAQKLRERIECWDWETAKPQLSFVITAAAAVFDPERRDRDDLSETRSFLYNEIDVSTSETFLSGLLRAHVESYEPGAPHTSTLAERVSSARPRMSRADRTLLEAFPELLDPRSGPDRIAERMRGMADPYAELVRLGLRNPHATGFMDHAHLALTRLVRDELSDRDRIDWYLRWLRPPGKTEGRTIGAETAIEALIHPWLKRNPNDKLTSYLVETLIELYGDPRIKSGGVWGGIGERYLAIVHRWLTREDMRFFTGVVDATQNDAMWPPRRDFWLKLYDEGKIDAAWAALSKEGFQYAIRHLMRQDAKNAHTRVGYQAGKQGTNTSLLIMKIGNKIMVDGCHNYRTHVFDIADPMAPKLFEEGYDCVEIMRASDRRRSKPSKPHNSIPAWSRWVRDMINADVEWSQQTRPYSFVARPRPPRPKNTPAHQTAGATAIPWATPPREPRPAQPDRPRPALPPDPGQGRLFTPSALRHGATLETPTPGATGSRASGASQPGTPAPRETPKGQALTERLIASGPAGAAAVISYVTTPTPGRSRQALSPKAREALDLLLLGRTDLPVSLRNSLEFLLIGIKRSGTNLDELFGAAPPTTAHPSLLPSKPEPRLEVLRQHVDALERLGAARDTFQKRKLIAQAIQKVRDGDPDLIPAEVAELQFLYAELQKDAEKKT